LEVTEEGFADRLIQIGELDVKVPGNAAKILQMFEDMIKAAFGKKVGDGTSSSASSTGRSSSPATPTRSCSWSW
jgi:hypothetical protein